MKDRNIIDQIGEDVVLLDEVFAEFLDLMDEINEEAEKE